MQVFTARLGKWRVATPPLRGIAAAEDGDGRLAIMVSIYGLPCRSVRQRSDKLKDRIAPQYVAYDCPSLTSALRFHVRMAEYQIEGNFRSMCYLDEDTSTYSYPKRKVLVYVQAYPAR
jgi:hypothetical protein